jgi:hypothetical protein
MGKSFTLPVASQPPTLATAAAIRQSAWLSVMPNMAQLRRQLPASSPSAPAEWRHPQGCQQMIQRNVHRRSAGGLPRRTSMRTLASSRSAPRRGRLSDPSPIAGALRPHPCFGIRIPLMAVVVDAGDGGFDLVPSSFVVEGSANTFGDERVPPAGTHPPVQLGDQLIFKGMCRRMARVWGLSTNNMGVLTPAEFSGSERRAWGGQGSGHSLAMV